MRNPVAHRAVRMIAEAAAAVPWLVYEGEDELADDAVAGLLARPNARMGGNEFFEALYGHLQISGNAFVEGVRIGGRLRELHLLRPDRVRVIEGRDGWPEAYEYRAGAHVRRYPAADGGGDGAAFGGTSFAHSSIAGSSQSARFHAPRRIVSRSAGERGPSAKSVCSEAMASSFTSTYVALVAGSCRRTGPRSGLGFLSAASCAWASASDASACWMVFGSAWRALS